MGDRITRLDTTSFCSNLHRQQPIDFTAVDPRLVEDVNPQTQTVTSNCKVCKGNGLDQKSILSIEEAILYWADRIGIDNFTIIKLAKEYNRIVNQPFEYEEHLKTNNELLETAYMNVIIDPDGRR